MLRGYDDVIFEVDRRVAEWTHLPPVHGEDMQVLRYQNNQSYEAHWDDLDPTEGEVAKQGLGGGSVRVATVLMFLSGERGAAWAHTRAPCTPANPTLTPTPPPSAADVEEGGETAFPHSQWLDKEVQTAGKSYTKCTEGGVAAHPRKGNAVMFWDTKVGSIYQDKWSMHAGCAVLKGTKWSATKWVSASATGARARVPGALAHP